MIGGRLEGQERDKTHGARREGTNTHKATTMRDVATCVLAKDDADGTVEGYTGTSVLATQKQRVLINDA